MSATVQSCFYSYFLELLIVVRVSARWGIFSGASSGCVADAWQCVHEGRLIGLCANRRVLDPIKKLKSNILALVTQLAIGP